MSTGTVEAIFVAPSGAAPAMPVREVRAITSRGLEGDRYFLKNGTFSQKSQSYQQATFIEIEAIEALAREEGIELSPGDSRRNIITRGVALNHLVGRTFRAGSATFQGIKLCEPCGHLEKLTKPGVMKALIHRGGLRCEIVSDGVIREGDSIAPVES